MALKFLREELGFNNVEIMVENQNSTNKIYRIKGPFVVAEVKNANQRIYPKTILERELNRYNETKIKTKRSVGELDHAQTPSINLDRISHLVESFEWKDNVGYGVAKLIDTPMGRIAKTLVDEGIKLGISSRGLGSVVNGIVDESYRFVCADLVHEPSGPGCFLDPVLENREYIIKDDQIIEQAIDSMKKKLDKHGSKVIKEAMIQFIKAIK